MVQYPTGLVPLLSTLPTGMHVPQLGNNEPEDTSHTVQMGRRAVLVLLGVVGLGNKSVLRLGCMEQLFRLPAFYDPRHIGNGPRHWEYDSFVTLHEGARLSAQAASVHG